MAEGVVYVLEAVEVEIEQGQFQVLLRRAVERLADAFAEHHPVGQAGEVVVMGEEADAPLALDQRHVLALGLRRGLVGTDVRLGQLGLGNLERGDVGPYGHHTAVRRAAVRHQHPASAGHPPLDRAGLGTMPAGTVLDVALGHGSRSGQPARPRAGE